MISREFALVILYALTSLFGAYSYLWVDDDIAYTNTWMLCNALSQLALLIAFRLVVKEIKIQTILSALIFLAVGEVIDELFFDPTVFGWNELGVLIIAAVYTYLKLCTKKQS